MDTWAREMAEWLRSVTLLQRTQVPFAVPKWAVHSCLSLNCGSYTSGLCRHMHIPLPHHIHTAKQKSRFFRLAWWLSEWKPLLPDLTNLSSGSRTQMVEKENWLPKVVLKLRHVYHGAHGPTCSSTQSVTKFDRFLKVNFVVVHAFIPSSLLTEAGRSLSLSSAWST